MQVKYSKLWYTVYRRLTKYYFKLHDIILLVLKTDYIEGLRGQRNILLDIPVRDLLNKVV